MNDRVRRQLLLALGLALAGLVRIYWESFETMAAKWWDDAAFTYGFLIAPIGLWLAWQKRQWLAAVPIGPSWFGVVAALALGWLWVVARGTGVLVLEQSAVVGMLAATVLALLGPQATRVLAFPLAFLFFMVPFGRAIVPWLMQATADVATPALQWSGIPVFRSHMHITIPGGSFEVARACSGIAFLMTALVLGTLYAYLNYAGWKKRTICVLAAVSAPILANGVRVYLTIAVAYLTDMRFGPGAEHLVIAQAFFVLVLLGMFWLGIRWQDARPSPPATGVSRATPGGRGVRALVPVPLAVLVMLLAPHYHTVAAAGFRSRSEDLSHAVRLPPGSSGWQGPLTEKAAWHPLYHDGLAERTGTYRDTRDAKVDVFVAVYGLGATAGAEMISYDNVLHRGEHASLATVWLRRVDLDDGRTLKVRELVVPDADGEQCVWHWFVLGDRTATSPYVVKALEAVAWLSRRAATERVVTLATPSDSNARERLQSFVRMNPNCIAGGFAAEACDR